MAILHVHQPNYPPPPRPAPLWPGPDSLLLGGTARPSAGLLRIGLDVVTQHPTASAVVLGAPAAIWTDAVERVLNMDHSVAAARTREFFVYARAWWKDYAESQANAQVRAAPIASYYSSATTMLTALPLLVFLLPLV